MYNGIRVVKNSNTNFIFYKLSLNSSFIHTYATYKINESEAPL